MNESQAKDALIDALDELNLLRRKSVEYKYQRDELMRTCEHHYEEDACSFKGLNPCNPERCPLLKEQP
jgi:hypothetical protein